MLAASLVVLALVAGIIGTTWGMVRATHAKAEVVSEAKQKDAAFRDKEAALADARDKLWLSLYEQARARRFSRQMGQRLDSLDALVKAAAIRPDERLRDEAIAAMALPDIRLEPSSRRWRPLNQGFFFDALYRLQARVNDQGVFSVCTVPDDREIQRIDSGPIKSFSTLGGLLSPDGRYLATWERDNPVRVWRVADGKVMLRVELPQSQGWAFSRDSRHLAVGQLGWVIRFDVETGEELNRWRLPETRRVNTLAFHPDNRRLAVGYRDLNFASVFDATNGELVAKQIPVGADERKVAERQVVAWHPDGARLAVAGSDERIQIWNVATARKIATLEGHVQEIDALTFHPDGGLLASRSWDGVLRLWEPTTGRPLLQVPMSAWPQFSSDGRWLGIAWNGEQVQLLEVTPSREYRTLGAGQVGYSHESDISPDGRLLALNMYDAVRLWHLASGRELAVLPPGRPLFQSNAELLIAGPGELHRWPIQPGAAANELRLGPPRTIGLPALPLRAARSQDGRTLAIVSHAGNTGLLVDLATDSVRAPRFGHAAAEFVDLSRDGRWLATSGWHSDRVRLWNAGTGKMVHEWMLFRSMVFFTPDSRALIISQGDEFTFWNVETLQQVRQIRRDLTPFPGHVAFSPDGGLMALEMAPGIIHLKDSATDRTVAKLEDPHGDRAGWMSFTPDGTQLLVTATYAKAVHVWDLRAIRQRLNEMKLDWDWPEFKPATSARAADEPPSVEVLFHAEAEKGMRIKMKERPPRSG